MNAETYEERRKLEYWLRHKDDPSQVARREPCGNESASVSDILNYRALDSERGKGMVLASGIPKFAANVLSPRYQEQLSNTKCLARFL
jgi:hypothetical protein